MSKRRIIFRADGNSSIGIGHLIRSLALANMLKNDFECIFATRYLNDYLKEEINKSCESYKQLPENNHYNHFLDLLKGDEIVVLDNYFFDASYQQEIKDKGCLLVCIDDLHNQHFVADVVINHNLGVRHNDYSVEKYTQLLLGFDYALLREEFIGSPKQNIEKKYAILIMMGGADPYDHTLQIVQQLKSMTWSLPMAVIYSKKKLEEDDSVKQFKNISADAVAKLMHQSQIGFFPASTVSIEACACRLPFATGFFVDNQKEVYASLLKNELGIGVGEIGNNQQAVKNILTRLYNDHTLQNQLRTNQEKALDKEMKQRFLKVFYELSHAK